MILVVQVTNLGVKTFCSLHHRADPDRATTQAGQYAGKALSLKIQYYLRACASQSSQKPQ